MLTSVTNTVFSTGDSEPSISEFPERQRAQQLRQKRRQVARACDECRIHRTKCDNNHPCSNCKTQGRQCSNSDATKVSTLSQAYKEIENLRQKVQELEVKLEQERTKSVNVDQTLWTPQSWSPSHVSPSESIIPDHGESKKKIWEGIQLRPARFPHGTWFGPSSLYYFISRLSVYLASSLQQTQSAAHLILPSARSGKLLDKPAADDEGDEDQVKEDQGHSISLSIGDSSMTGADLSPTQEEYFISLFWQSYHTATFAILDEEEFKKHHQSLWMTSGNVRKPSALVDIVLAMCIQTSVSTLPVSKQGRIAGNDDATIAGRWHYRRCQKLLTYELESPTISTLQCYLLCALYLCGGSFHNMVDSSCGLAVRTAYMLGLHLDPPQTMPQREQEKRRRLWWAVYLLDSKISMKLGRPFLLNDSYTMPRLPGDNNEVARLSGSTFAPLGGNVTWLSFNLHHTKLFMAIRAAHTALYDKDLNIRDNQTVWDDSQALEACAEPMFPYAKQLEEWVNNVPDALKTKRQNDGRPFSTDGSDLEVEQFAPLWLQRQRLLLELMYHNLCVNLYRPFISLVSEPTPGPMTEEVAMKCAAHAIAFTKIAYQILSSTSILEGWNEAFQWQWNASMTLVGFVLSYPHGQSTPAARSAIDLSVSVMEIFGNSFTVATGAAKIVRELCIKVDFVLAQKIQAKQSELLASYDAADAMKFGLNLGDSGKQSFTDKSFPMGNSMSIDSGFYDGLDGSNENMFDMALSVDFWGDLDTLWPTTEFSPENWAPTQY